MNHKVKALALTAVMAMGLTSAQPALAADSGADPLSLKIANAISPDRFFIRAGVIGVKVKTKSGDTYDATGPVLTLGDLQSVQDSSSTLIRDYLLKAKAVQDPNATTPVLVTSAQAQSIANALKNETLGMGLLVTFMEGADPQNPFISQLGTPKGIKGEATEKMGTAGLSLGYFLDDEYKWAVEAYVLAIPVKTSVVAKGNATIRESGLEAFTHARPFGLEGQKIINTKLLPPVVIFGKYWGDKKARFRPYTGLMAMYAIFYDTKATDALNSYVGGANPGDTTVSLKNTFGLGPMLGVRYNISDDWHLSFNVGSVKMKTQGTIVTRNTNIRDSTGAVQDYGAVGTDPTDPSLYDPQGNFLGSVSDTINSGETNFGNIYGGADSLTRRVTSQFGGVTGLISRVVADSKGQENLGTFVRKADTTLTSTIFMLSVGHSF